MSDNKSARMARIHSPCGWSFPNPILTQDSHARVHAKVFQQGYGIKGEFSIDKRDIAILLQASDMYLHLVTYPLSISSVVEQLREMRKWWRDVGKHIDQEEET